MKMVAVGVTKAYISKCAMACASVTGGLMMIMMTKIIMNVFKIVFMNVFMNISSRSLSTPPTDGI